MTLYYSYTNIFKNPHFSLRARNKYTLPYHFDIQLELIIEIENVA